MATLRELVRQENQTPEVLLHLLDKEKSAMMEEIRRSLGPAKQRSKAKGA